jgi:hypothetical protein
MTISAAAQNVCLWHKADMLTASANVRFRGIADIDLTSPMSANDPNR